MDIECKPGIYLFVGKPKSGKTHLARKIVFDLFKCGYFKFGLVFSETSHYNGDWGFFPDNRVVQYSNNAFKNYIAHLQKKQSELKKQDEKLPPSCLIVDDSLGRVNFWDDDWTNTFAIHRHLNLSIFIISQSIYAGGKGSSTLLRDCCSHAFMWRTNTLNSIKGFYTNFGSRYFEKLNDFKNFFEQGTSQKHRCFCFQNSDDPNKMYSFYIADPAYKVEKMSGF